MEKEKDTEKEKVKDGEKVIGIIHKTKTMHPPMYNMCHNKPLKGTSCGDPPECLKILEKVTGEHPRLIMDPLPCPKIW